MDWDDLWKNSGAYSKELLDKLREMEATTNYSDRRYVYYREINKLKQDYENRMRATEFRARDAILHGERFQEPKPEMSPMEQIERALGSRQVTWHEIKHLCDIYEHRMRYLEQEVDMVREQLNQTSRNLCDVLNECDRRGELTSFLTHPNRIVRETAKQIYEERKKHDQTKDKPDS